MQQFAPHKLKALRLERGLNRDQVAYSIRRTAQMYAFYEQGKNQPPLKVLATLAEALECDVSAFFEEAETDGEA